MESISVSNFRSFKNSGRVDVKPLTFFVGLNSSGKSSFLRLFPLLRQSFEEKTSGPILWYGDYVDFGNFNDVLPVGSQEDNVFMSFDLAIKPRDMFDSSYDKRVNDTSLTYKVGLRLNSIDNTEIDFLELDFGFCKIRMHNKDGVVFKCEIDEVEQKYNSYLSLFLFKDKFIPMLKPFVGMNWVYIPDSSVRSFLRDHEEKSVEKLLDDMFELLKPYFHRRTDKNKVKKNLFYLSFGQPDEVIESLKSVYSKHSYFISNIERMPSNSLMDFTGKLLLLNAACIFSKIGFEIDSFSKSIKYIAPLRAHALRYYRHQDLRSNEVDHQGGNFPMVLRGFTEEQKRDFETWVSDNFGFLMRIFQDGSQFEIKISRNHGKDFYNIMDMGFGFSQIIPIIINVWLAINKKRDGFDPFLRRGNIIFAIEQPELHLHPGFQALFADSVVRAIKAAKKNDIDLRFVIETHSETIINRSGLNIEKGSLDVKDVAVYLFEKDEEINQTSVRRSDFNEEGYLVDWPVGFFEADYDI